MATQYAALQQLTYTAVTVQVSEVRLTLTVAVYVLLTAGVSKQGKKERLHTE